LLFCGLVYSQTTKDVIISAITVTDTHTTFGSAHINIQCFNAASRSNGPSGWVQFSNGMEMGQVQEKNTWYIVETLLFTWNPAAVGSTMFCQVYEKGVVTDTTLGETDDIPFTDITYGGILKQTTQTATEATFYIRCANCPPPSPAPIGSLQTKTIFVKTVQVSDTLDSVFSDPDMYLNCDVAGSGETYALELPTVNNANKEYTIDKAIADFKWSVGFADANGTLLSGSMGHSGTCGIFEHDTTDSDDSLGTVIVHFTDITSDGAKYPLSNDPNSWVVLYDCSDPSVCSSGNSISESFSFILLVLVAVKLWM